jgi:hypothetical protein
MENKKRISKTKIINKEDNEYSNNKMNENP